MELTQIPLFQELTQEELTIIKDFTHKRTYPKKTVLFVEGQGSDGIYLITEGLIKVYKLHPDGREKTLALLGPGDILGEMSVTGEEMRSATAETLERTIILAIARTDFQKLLTTMPSLASGLIKLLSDRLRSANRQIEELAFLNARSRVISNLILLAQEQGQKKPAGIFLPLRLTHAELAKLIGVTRETVTRVLTELQQDELLAMQGKKMTFLNLDKLYREIM